MDKSKEKASRLDYTALRELVRSRNIKFVEARGLDTRKGVRFKKDGTDWIAIDTDLPVTEKIRALGYLLENEPAEVASKIGIKGITDSSSMSPVLTLCCS